MRAGLLGLFGVIVLVPACTCSTPARPPSSDGSSATSDGGSCAGAAAPVCEGTIAVTCSADATRTTRDCALVGEVCAPGLGCRPCVPGRRSCDGRDAVECGADGQPRVADACDPAAGEVCRDGSCVSLCAEAEASHSYVGCEYWPVPTATSHLLFHDDFAYGVVVANAQSDAVEITVTRGSTTVTTETVAPGATAAIVLPWIDALQPSVTAEPRYASTLVADGAYRLRSSMPVTVYQFSPLEIRQPCTPRFGSTVIDGQCVALSADASLLLPTHVLTGSYIVMSFPTRMDTGLRPIPGFVTIVGVTPEPVSVSIELSTAALGSRDGLVSELAAGSTTTFTLHQGETLQIFSGHPPTCDRLPGGGLFCDTRDFDLTGTEIRATGPVSVISGHDCGNVPYDRGGCDHLEESMLPLEAWGDDAIVSLAQPRADDVSNLVRIVSSHDDNTLTFDPPSVHGTVTLDRGDILELDARVSFRVQGTEAFSVGQFIRGVDDPIDGLGDPSMSVVIPTDQFRTSYSILTPTTYTASYLGITAPMGSTVELDGAPVIGFVPVGSSGFGVARVGVAGGAHLLTGSAELGVVAFGVGRASSYMYPGGLDLEPIDTLF
jgi:hypothetical protein